MEDVQIRLQDLRGLPEHHNSAAEHPEEASAETPAGPGAVDDADAPYTADAADASGREDTGTGPEPVSEPDDDTLTAALEAILFAMGEAVPIDAAAAALGVSRRRAEEAADALADRCRQPGSGLALNWYEDAVQLSTKPDLCPYLVRIASEPKKPKLTPTLMETLSIIAFRQPVTRMEVENIRGVNSDFAISRLVSYDLVREVGRREVPGRPLLFGTTEQFLRSFGIRSIDELPEPDASQIEEFREEAEEEVSSRLNV